MSGLAAKLVRAAPAEVADDEEVVSAMDRRVPEPPRGRRRLLWIGLGIALIAVAAGAYVRFGLTRTLVVDADKLVIAPVKDAMFTEYVPANAVVVPRTTAYVDAVEGGQVAEVLVEEGAIVKRGDVLVKLQNTNLQLEVLGRQAQLMEQLDRLNATILSFEQARLAHERELIDVAAQIEQLTQRLERRQALRSSGAVSQAELDELAIELTRHQRLQETMREAQRVDERFRVEQVSQLRDAVKTTRENLAMAGATLSNLAVKAPISGQLTRLEAELGEAKGAGQRIGQIDETGAYKLEASIDEFYLGRIRPGQSATVQIDGESQKLTVTKVYPQVRARQFQVDLAFDGMPPERLRPGQSMQVRLQVSAAQRSVVVGNGPYFDDTGGAWVFVVSKSGTEARQRTVKLGRRNSDQVEVLSGLVPGERIITSSYESLRDFDRIRIRGGNSG